MRRDWSDTTAPPPPPLPPLSGNLVEDALTLTGYSPYFLAELIGVSRPTVYAWRRENPSGKRKDTLPAIAKLEALVYVGRAFYRRGGPMSVQVWLSWPAYDAPFALLRRKDGAQLLVNRANEVAGL